MFIGYDSREKIASQVCKFSLQKNTDIPIKINFLKINELKKKKNYIKDK